MTVFFLNNPRVEDTASEVIMIIVRITMNVRPEKRKEVMQTLLSMIEPTRQERSCLGYHVLQNIEDENSVSIIGEWETREDLDLHMRSDRFGILLGTKSLLKEKQGILIYTIVHSERMKAVNTVGGKRT
jgi:quinol monooxygenase YgiN